MSYEKEGSLVSPLTTVVGIPFKIVRKARRGPGLGPGDQAQAGPMAFPYDCE